MKASPAVVFVALAIASALPAAAAQRAFVSSTGNDGNAAAGCTLAAPCRSFQAAHGAVDAGGEIVALDTAGYGVVTITKSVTIMANPGVVAGVSVSSGAGITMNTPGVEVILRGLNVNNVGTGSYGIDVTDGASLAIENCVLSRFDYGAFVQAAVRLRVVNTMVRGNNIVGLRVAGGATADIIGSHFVGNHGAGVSVRGGPAASTTTVSISDSVSSGNQNGFLVGNLEPNSTLRMSCIRCTASSNSSAGFVVFAFTDSSAFVAVSYSKATFNSAEGFRHQAAGGTSTFVTQGNNMLYGNAAGDTSGTMTPVVGQ